MSLKTPSNSRMNPAFGGSIKLTPTPSPSLFLKANPLRSPFKAQRGDVSLALRHVIGATTSSANAFDSLPADHSFAFCAGAAAVVASVDSDHRVSQRFYRARPSANPINPFTSIYGGPATPTQNESRNRTAASLRDGSTGASPYASPAVDWGDSASNKAWSARDRVKAATCVSFSPDGKMLAVGETGYKPRVLIFSTAGEAPPDIPLTVLADHHFGVNCVAFSPDSRYLASLGSSNDGYLYIWSISPRTGSAVLHASNKCTSNVNRMTWMGNNLITVGTRHIKVWRIEDPQPTPQSSQSQPANLTMPRSTHKTLPGRNCLLEDLLEENFTSVVAVSSTKALVASDSGNICLIDDDNAAQRLSRVANAGFSVRAMSIDSLDRLHLAGNQDTLKMFIVQELLDSSTAMATHSSGARLPLTSPTMAPDQLLVVATLQKHILTVDSRHSICLSSLCASDNKTSIGPAIQKLPAHGDSVLGVIALMGGDSTGASFCTWSSRGSVLFWSQDGTCQGALQVPLEQLDGLEVEANGLKVLRASADADYIFTGDKYGVLRVIDRASRSSLYESKAHANEITCIDTFEDTDCAYIASSARDRMIQIFQGKNGCWDLLQTLDEHVGAVTGVLFSKSGHRLVSMSSDRSLVIRELISREDSGTTMRAFVILRTITLRSTPTSITWDINQDSNLIVSTIDRHLHKFNTLTGQCLANFRTTDTDGGDAVALSSLVHISRSWGPPLIAGVSSADKSIRLYEEHGVLSARDWGHTEGVTDIALLQNRDPDDEDLQSVVTVAMDGTIFIWSLTMQDPTRQEMSKSMDLIGPSTPTNPALLSSRPPIRRVFSQSELAKFQRSGEEDSPIATSNHSPKLRKRLSKFTLAQTPKLEPSPMPQTTQYGTVRRTTRNRSPSPPSPRNPQLSSRRSSIDLRIRSKPAANDFGSLKSSSESLCRTLRAYRKRLATSTEMLGAEAVRDVERELAVTARAVGEKAKSNDALSESVMTKLLDQYSERLVSILDEKLAATVALRVRENSESGLSAGLASPALDEGLEKVMSPIEPIGEEDAMAGAVDAGKDGDAV